MYLFIDVLKILYKQKLDFNNDIDLNLSFIFDNPLVSVLSFLNNLLDLN